MRGSFDKSKTGRTASGTAAATRAESSSLKSYTFSGFDGDHIHPCGNFRA